MARTDDGRPFKRIGAGLFRVNREHADRLTDPKSLLCDKCLVWVEAHGVSPVYALVDLCPRCAAKLQRLLNGLFPVRDDEECDCGECGER